METGWLLYENTWYYLKATGEMASDEWVDGGKYYVDANGVYIPGKVKVTGSWLKDNTGWWYRNTDGTYPRNQCSTLMEIGTISIRTAICRPVGYSLEIPGTI